MKSKLLKKRLIFLAVFVFLFFVEVLVALYVHDDFIRPYVGDMIVTVVGQYFNYVDILGITNPILVTMMGTSFAWADIACYAVGCVVTAIVDFVRFRKKA